jgi:epoxide hydrolase 4
MGWVGPEAAVQLGGVPLTHHRLRGDGIFLHVISAGEGPPVLLLHGFPEHWWSWRYQIPALAQAGFSVWAADLRGYNLSDRPRGPRAYRLQHLIHDVVHLVHAIGRPRVHLGGHDWGGIIAWGVAEQHPELVDKLLILNAPHLRLYRQHLWHDAQWLRSAYVPFFATPILPETFFRAGGVPMLRRLYKGLAGRPDTLDDRDIDAMLRPMMTRAGLRAGLDYYRANMGSGELASRHRNGIEHDTLVVWGDRDPALSPVLLDGLADVAPRARVTHVGDAGHWVHAEAAELVNRELVGFLTT